jgi:hypothetical protein
MSYDVYIVISQISMVTTTAIKIPVNKKTLVLSLQDILGSEYTSGDLFFVVKKKSSPKSLGHIYQKDIQDMKMWKNISSLDDIKNIYS